MTVMGFAGAGSISQLISAALFFPLGAYFLLLVLPKKKKALIMPATFYPFEKEFKRSNVKLSVKKAEEKPIELKRHHVDIDRRMFLKLIGSASIGLFFLAIFTRRADAAFFGSMPGPGTVSLKDSTGALIDPAIKTPTDGYKISQLDDSTPAYYGFLDKRSNWYIMQEDSAGGYRYAKGSSGFSTNWTNRATLTYNYFDTVFN